MSIEVNERRSNLTRGVLADQVADYIVECVARRELVSGERINEVKVANAIGVSRVPVREATRMLASQGIVVALPHRGMRVARFDSDWAEQLRNARIAIELLAAKTVSRKIRDDQKLARPLLEQIARLEREAENPRDGWLSLNRADIAFHATIFEIADSPLLSTLWAGIAHHVLILFAKETFRYASLDEIASHHQRYLDVLQEGDFDRLADELEMHIRGQNIDGTGAS